MLMIVLIVVLILAAVFSVIAGLKLRSLKNKAEPIVPSVSANRIETYGHDIDLIRKIKEQLPSRPTVLDGTRWEVVVDRAGGSILGKNDLNRIEPNDMILHLKLVELRNMEVPIAQIDYNISRWFYGRTGEYVTFKFAFGNNDRDCAIAAKSTQNEILSGIKTWAKDVQDKYEYENFPPDGTVELV